VLAGVFIWPFGYVTSYPALVALSLIFGKRQRRRTLEELAR
jgi:hypothetical protein